MSHSDKYIIIIINSGSSIDNLYVLNNYVILIKIKVKATFNVQL